MHWYIFNLYVIFDQLFSQHDRQLLAQCYANCECRATKYYVNLQALYVGRMLHLELFLNMIFLAQLVATGVKR